MTRGDPTNGNRRRRRNLHGRTLAPILALLLVLLLAPVIAGCESAPDEPALQGARQPVGTEDALMRAYSLAHPSQIDGTLHPVEGGPEEITAEIRKVLDPSKGVWLPGYLPRGFALAAPFNGNGTGAANPNPYASEQGYAVTYTDGTGFLTVCAGTEDDLSQGEWEPVPGTVDGRALRLQRSSDLMSVATVDDSGPQLLVVGAGFGGDRLESELVRVAESLIRQ